jgi:hypothetical protein
VDCDYSGEAASMAGQQQQHQQGASSIIHVATTMFTTTLYKTNAVRVITTTDVPVFCYNKGITHCFLPSFLHLLYPSDHIQCVFKPTGLMVPLHMLHPSRKRVKIALTIPAAVACRYTFHCHSVKELRSNCTCAAHHQKGASVLLL